MKKYMKVVQINAVYGQGSTGTIVRDIEQLCFECEIGKDCTRTIEPLKNVEPLNKSVLINNIIPPIQYLDNHIKGLPSSRADSENYAP